ncbi:hypothetical protein Corgl_0437 [Coriobacterium glomerans PW2]|uniref:Uncharacterized protein n=1 Tax=Coriobacterium glomerans (strain ATCC 49209 / DSM 20642 / JCM 10262 / PW2) TaxID=700015 RepID=F2N780_CORGP|nr:hypothetical protein [Coriobacterium glomerans]AEB06555.1 hypothetical protein Corgl_0437 [Coriobacterium glomerans PW2]
MTDPAFIICSLLLLFFGIYIGFAIGSEWAKRVETKAGFWGATVACVCVAAIAFAALSALPLMYSAVVGLMAGCLVGLKTGFGSSTGPWRAIDHLFGADEARRQRATRGTRRAHRGAPGMRDRDLMSVSGGGRDEANQQTGTSSRRRKKR